MTDKKSNDSRRKLLKSIAAGSGAVVAGKTLPDAWTKPVIDSVMLPAHAETTSGGDYFGSFTWGDDVPIKLCIQCVGSDCSAKTLEGERYYYEGSGPLNAVMTLTDPTGCETSYTVKLKVETVNGVATGQFALGPGGEDPIPFSIPMAACGFSADDNKCGDGNLPDTAQSENRR